jgi:hypothetical protein
MSCKARAPKPQAVRWRSWRRVRIEFMAIAVDDPLFKQGGLNMLDKWLKESSLTEFHLYSGGNHGFGMRPQGTTSDNWIEHYLSWLGKQ